MPNTLIILPPSVCHALSLTPDTDRHVHLFRVLSRDSDTPDSGELVSIYHADSFAACEAIAYSLAGFTNADIRVPLPYLRPPTEAPHAAD